MQVKATLCKIINILIFLSYLLTYAIAFCAFDDSLSNYDEDSFEEYMLKTIMSVGMAFTLALIAYLYSKKNAEQFTFAHSIYNLFQVPVLIYCISSAKTLLRFTLSNNDSITEFHCKITIIMSYFIIALIVISVINSRPSLTTKNDTETTSDNNIDVTPYCSSNNYHIIVSFMLIITTLFCIVYTYGFFGVFFIIPFAFSFPLPATIFLSTIVKHWIEYKKYYRSAFAYIIYMHLVYGTLYRLFCDELYGFAMNYNVLKIPFNNFIPLLNIIIAGIVAVILIAKGIKHSFQQRDK